MKHTIAYLLGIIVGTNMYGQLTNSPGSIEEDSSHANTLVIQKINFTPPNTYPYALIAGGSKGIGYALAEALARRKFNLILIARHMDSLVAAKRKLESMYGVRVEYLALDLSKEYTADSIGRWCMERDIPLRMLCNVAGFGGTKDYLSLPVDSVRYMIRLNLESTVVLTQILLPLLEKNSPSYILNVASMAGLAPIPVKNMYAATKSAVIFFSYALRYQLKDKNISVSVLAPGPVYTKPEIVKDTKEKLGWLGNVMEVPPKRVGEIAIQKTLEGNLLIVPGTTSKLTSFIIRILPRRTITSIYNKVGKK
jgi:short-subunit dehydrogenase